MAAPNQEHSLYVKRAARQKLGALHDPATGLLKLGLYSKHATRIQVELFTKKLGQSAVHTQVLDRDANGVWRGEVDLKKISGLDPAAPVLYGYRAWGPNFEFDPKWKPGQLDGFNADVDAQGNRFNPNKLLGDPRRLEQSHDPRNDKFDDFSVFTTGKGNSARDSAHFAPKSVTSPALALMAAEKPRPPKPNRPFKDEVIYEVHVRGLTKNDPSIPEALRGTYAGAALKAQYLKDLGITAVEFLPVQEFADDQNDLKAESDKDTNYWGYMTDGFFAPNQRFAADRSPGGATREFKAMVDAFHRLGIKVIVDGVYNHTGEGGVHDVSNPDIATLLHMHGIDNQTYHLLSGDRRYYYDVTGTGASFNTANPPVADLVVDSVDYWTRIMGVDDFRYDLAAALGNEHQNNDYNFNTSHPDNLLNRLPREVPFATHIAEPWAAGGRNSYQVGGFGPGWKEWNGKFRDVVRKSQNSYAEVSPGQLAAALAGSAAQYQHNRRTPSASVNFVTVHDGFTLWDLHKYDRPNNMQGYPYGPSGGGEQSNHSSSHGGNPVAQKQAARTSMALLLLSHGVPLINGGDEFLRSTNGNNNVYNTDSPGTWHDWKAAEKEVEFTKFTKSLIQFRHAHPALRPENYVNGDAGSDGVKRMSWHGPNGHEADGKYMDSSGQSFLGWRIDGKSVPGEPAASIYVAYNWGDKKQLQLPRPRPGHSWYLASDTSDWMKEKAHFHGETTETPVGESYFLHGQALALFVEKADTVSAGYR